MDSSIPESDEHLFRKAFQHFPAQPWALAVALLAAHATLRFAGLWRPLFIPLSMILVWPAPWLLSSRQGRQVLGLRRPQLRWLAVGGLVGLSALVVCALAAWTAFGYSETNWFFRHASALGQAAAGVPPQLSVAQVFWFLTVPAMIFSPLAEEFLFRGYLLKALTAVLGPAFGLALQAAAFSLVHLAHYGLRPFQPELIPLWLASMFAVALVLGWLVRRSSSLWPAIAAHAVFNLSMNAYTFAAFSDVITTRGVIPGAA